MTRLVLSGALALALAGCASWLPSMPNLDFGGYFSELRVESEPPGAEARIASGPACRTPCTLRVEAKGDVTVTFSLEGYLPQTARAQMRVPGDPRFDPNAVSNVQLDPNPVSVVLDRAPPPPPPAKKIRRRAPPKRAPANAARPSGGSTAAPPAIVAPEPAGPRTLPSTIPGPSGPSISPFPPATTR